VKATHELAGAASGEHATTQSGSAQSQGQAAPTHEAQWLRAGEHVFAPATSQPEVHLNPGPPRQVPRSPPRAPPRPLRKARPPPRRPVRLIHQKERLRGTASRNTTTRHRRITARRMHTTAFHAPARAGCRGASSSREAASYRRCCYFASCSHAGDTRRRFRATPRRILRKRRSYVLGQPPGRSNSSCQSPPPRAT
jgi:hypothetical protein